MRQPTVGAVMAQYEVELDMTVCITARIEADNKEDADRHARYHIAYQYPKPPYEREMVKPTKLVEINTEVRTVN